MRRNYWTKEKCKEVALLCKYRTEFSKNYKVAYVTSSKKGWLGEICSHMEYDNVTPPYFWTKEKCKEVASKYICRSDFQKEDYNVYRRSYENGWLDEICNHMIKIGNLNKRLIYIFEFSDNSVYIGLTCDSKRRKNEHLTNNSPVYQHVEKTGLYPLYRELTDYIYYKEASDLEVYYVEKYKKIGFTILNKIKAGGLGGNLIKWDYETCKEEASKYTNRTNFCRYKRRAYDKCVREGWVDEFFKK